MSVTPSAATAITAVTELINAIAPHQGASAGITARDLARRLAVRPRRLRRMVSIARTQGVAICGTPATGYYLPTTADELDSACAFLQHRALHSLRLMSVMKRVALPTLLGQLLLAQG